LWPSFIALGIGLGFLITSSSEAIVGNAPVDDAGVAGGLQSTAVQLGGVMGTAILGSVLSSRIGSVLAGQLIGAGTPPALARQLASPGAQQLVAQGGAPAVRSLPAHIQAAIVTGSHDAFMTGLHTSLTVGAIIALAAAVLALFVRRGAASSGLGVAV
jgi:hypothetical protein